VINKDQKNATVQQEKMPRRLIIPSFYLSWTNDKRRSVACVLHDFYWRIAGERELEAVAG
jgi:hypothetical protein